MRLVTLDKPTVAEALASWAALRLEQLEILTDNLERELVRERKRADAHEATARLRGKALAVAVTELEDAKQHAAFYTSDITPLKTFDALASVSQLLTIAQMLEDRGDRAGIRFVRDGNQRAIAIELGVREGYTTDKTDLRKIGERALARNDATHGQSALQDTVTDRSTR